MIDLMWVEHKRVLLAMTVWNEDMEVLGDHRIMTMDLMQMNVDLEHRVGGPRVREKKDAESKEKRPLSWKKRVKDEDWIRFREVLCQELKERKEDQRRLILSRQDKKEWRRLGGIG